MYSKKNEIICLGRMKGYAYDCIARVFSPRSIAPALTTMGGGDRQPKILVFVGTKESKKGDTE